MIHRYEYNIFNFRLFDVSHKDKIDINELLSVKSGNETLKEMQHSKWATSNNLFDYNSFINDFYALLEEYNSYKSRELVESHQQQVSTLIGFMTQQHNNKVFSGNDDGSALYPERKLLLQRRQSLLI